MVAAAQLLEHLDQGLAVSDACVFRFRTAVTAFRMVLFAAIGLGMAVFAGLMGPQLHRPLTAISYGVVALFLLLMVQCFRLAVIAFVDLRRAKSSVLVVTPTTVVRRRRNKVDSWPFAEFPGVTFVRQSRRSTTTTSLDLADRPPPNAAIANAMGAGGITGIYLNRPGKTFDNELIDDLSFGPMDEILRALVTRVRVA